MWKGEKWGQSRLETAPLLKSKWLEKMAEPQFVNAADKPFDLIGFPNREPRSLDSGTYRDASLPVETRVEDLLKRMTLQEKVAQLTGWWDPNEEQLRREGRIHDPAFYGENAPTVLANLDPYTTSPSRKTSNNMPRCRNISGIAPVWESPRSNTMRRLMASCASRPIPFPLLSEFPVPGTRI